jgi:hypothetical protein
VFTAADCLIALRNGDDSDDAFVGAVLVAEFLTVVRRFLTK